jgi:hypothetical protein
VLPEGLGKLNRKIIHLTWSRTSGLPICSVALDPLCNRLPQVISAVVWAAVCAALRIQGQAGEEDNRRFRNLTLVKTYFSHVN